MFKIVDYIFPTIRAVIAVLALVAAVLNFVRWLKLRKKQRAGLYLACAIVMLLLSAYYFVWLYKAYLVGFHY